MVPPSILKNLGNVSGSSSARSHTSGRLTAGGRKKSNGIIIPSSCQKVSCHPQFWEHPPRWWSMCWASLTFSHQGLLLALLSSSGALCVLFCKEHKQMLTSSLHLMLICTQDLCKQEAKRFQSFQGGRADTGAHQRWLKNRSSRMCQGSGVPIKARLEGLWREEARSRGCPRSASVSSQQFIEQIRFHSHIRKWQWMAFTRWHV